MNLKPSFKALVAVLLAGIAAAACSIKEDRDECPCWLTVTLTDGGRSVPELVLSIWNPGELLREAVRTDDYPEGVERTVPKGLVTLSAHTRLHRMQPSGALLLIPYGQECDSLLTHRSEVACLGETARDTVRLHRQYATVFLSIENLEQGIHYPYDLVARSSVDGFDLLSGLPHAGAHSLPLVPLSEGEYAFRVPRQLDESLTLDLYLEGELIDSYPIGTHIMKAGYDWEAEDLADIRIGMDYGHSEPHIVIEPWEDGAVYDEII